MEWMVGYARDLAAAERIPVTTNITHIVVGPKAENARDMFKPLLSGLLWPTNRSRVGCVAIVLVQGLCDKAQVPLLESPVPFKHKFDLWGIGGF